MRRIILKRIIAASTLVSLIAVMLTLPPVVGESTSGPFVDDLYHVFIPSPSAQVTALEKGEIDIINHYRGLELPEDVDRLSAEGFKITLAPLYGLGWLMPNSRVPPISDVYFRRALSHLIPKKRVISAVLGPLAIEESSPLPVSWGKWYNPNVTVFEYDPLAAIDTLISAGYNPVGWDGEDPASIQHWIDPATKNPVREIKVTYPAERIAYAAFTEAFVNECVKIGLPLKLDPTDIGGWVYKCVITHDFDISGLMAWNFDYNTPDALMDLYHSSIMPDRPHYVNITEVDSLLEIIMTSLNETEIQEAAWEVQAIIADSCMVMPVYVPIVAQAYSPNLMGIIESTQRSAYPLERLLLRWKTGGLGGTVKMSATAEPDTLWTGSTILGASANLLDLINDGLSLWFREPYTQQFRFWAAKDRKLETWTVEPGVEGMKTTIWLQKGMYWQDGVEVTAEDIKFSLEYLQDKNVPNAMPMWQYLVNVTVINPYQCVVYHNKTSLWVADQIAEWALENPKHIWENVEDPFSFRPWEEHHPTVAGLTKLIGSGPFIFPYGGWEVGKQIHLVANRNYWRARPLVGDINFDFKADILDISMAARAFGSKPNHPRWNIAADVNGDKNIDILDIAKIAKDFGKTW